MFRKLLGLLVFCCLVLPLYSQPDVIRISNYNVLNFPGNNGDQRVEYFATVVNGMMPDIMVCQEVLSAAGVNMILDDVLGEEFSIAPFNDGPDTDNMIFFRSNLFEYVDQHIVETTLRDINVYQLNYLLDAAGPDLFIASAHLKASQGDENEQRRLGEVEDFLEYYDQELVGENVIFCGDLNLYTSNEPAYQALLGDDYFYDPINRPGTWHNSGEYADIHTQSPRTEQFGGGATGGMDDRFDFVLPSPAFNDDIEWGCDPETYTAYGNDGNHFNQAINEGDNLAVGNVIANALHEASDHIPVFMDLLYYNEGGFAGIIPIQGEYFELISFPYLPEDLAVTEIFADMNNLAVVYQNDGSIYIPQHFNSIHDIDITQGYRVFSRVDDELEVTGQTIDNNILYSITANRWNWIGYPFDLPMPVEDALAEIEDEIVIIQNDEGGFWIPELNINTLVNMNPGEGYAIISTEDIDFRYLETPALNNDIHELYTERTQYIDNTVTSTGKPYIVLVELTDPQLFNQISRLEIYDHQELVGSSLVDEDSRFTPVICWEGDYEMGMTGFNPGDKMTIISRDAANNEISTRQTGSTLYFGEDAYAMLQLDAVENTENLPLSFAINDIYPNPFNSTARINIQLPYASDLNISLYNIEGREVQTRQSKYASMGTTQFSIEAGDLSSGIYFLSVQTSRGDKDMKKLVLIR